MWFGHLSRTIYLYEKVGGIIQICMYIVVSFSSCSHWIVQFEGKASAVYVHICSFKQFRFAYGQDYNI